MEVLYEHCAGLDVHKKGLVACVLHSAPGGTTRKERRSFSTMLPDLERLRDWLVQEGCTHVVMEATGVFWKPVYNVLESQLTVLVVNPEHVKVLAGRKTDAKDAEWLADLLRHGLLQGSFIPDRDQRDLRELTRLRTALTQDRVRAVNRLQKSLEGANIKLASVLSDVMGVSGQRILDALLQGEDDPEALVGLAHGSLRDKHEALKQALMGRLKGRLHFVVSQELAQIRSLDEQIAACDVEVANEMHPFDQAINRLDAIPGINRRSAENLLAEIGQDLSRWPTVAQFNSWCGVCPGNKASGGKRRRAPVRKGNPWVKRTATEAAWAASHTKNSYLGERYRSLVRRKGHERAIVAVAHEILTIVYYLLTRDREYEDLGVHYAEERNRAAIERHALRQLDRLGYNVNLATKEAAA
jgi:transposase